MHGGTSFLPPSPVLALKIPCLLSSSSSLGAIERGMAEVDMGQTVSCCIEKNLFWGWVASGDQKMLRRRYHGIIVIFRVSIVTNYSMREGVKEASSSWCDTHIQHGVGCSFSAMWRWIRDGCRLGVCIVLRLFSPQKFELRRLSEPLDSSNSEEVRSLGCQRAPHQVMLATPENVGDPYSNAVALSTLSNSSSCFANSDCDREFGSHRRSDVVGPSLLSQDLQVLLPERARA